MYRTGNTCYEVSVGVTVVMTWSTLQHATRVKSRVTWIHNECVIISIEHWTVKYATTCMLPGPCVGRLTEPLSWAQQLIAWVTGEVARFIRNLFTSARHSTMKRGIESWTRLGWIHERRSAKTYNYNQKHLCMLTQKQEKANQSHVWEYTIYIHIHRLVMYQSIDVIQ